MKLYVDAAEERKIINRFGRIKKTGSWKYAIVDETGKFLKNGINTKITWQIEAEAFGVLQAVNYLIDNNIKEAIIVNDNLPIVSVLNDGSLKSKNGNMTSKYIWIIKKIINENNLNIKFDWCSSKENLADYESRKVN